MKKGFSLGETSLVLLLLVITVVFITNLGFSYLNILFSIKERFIALNLAQEGLELAFALRNSQLENFSADGNWLGIATSGSYCLNFETSSNRGRITFTKSNFACLVNNNYYRLLNFQDFENPANNDLRRATSVKVISEVKFGHNIIKLNTLLTKWHVVFH